MINIEKLKSLAESAKNDCGDYVALNDYGMAVLPAVVLALIADYERVTNNRDMWKGQVERQAEELASLRAEVEEWKSTLKFNEGCWSEERVTMIDKLQDVRSDHDQLKAECEGLRKAMRAISNQVDGNIRETVRDCVNGRDDVQDIYGYCDQIDAIIDEVTP